ncbi:peptidoglycan DD-metalloendopeptidase family protein [Cohnella suwonensis]|uniref:Peptidoglycan DD-metalloendopeptidase family protein n=1 Tax=Cohnella suwonensis TaxID=696072 RepID=A0ABW0LUI0_9BACL
MTVRDNVRERRRERIQQLIMSEQSFAGPDKKVPTASDDEQQPESATLRKASVTDSAPPAERQQGTSEVPSSPGTIRVRERGASSGEREARNGSLRSPDAPSIPSSDEGGRIPPGQPAETSGVVRADVSRFAVTRDPELWWKEREKQIQVGRPNGWQGIKGLPPTSNAPSSHGVGPPTGSGWNKLKRGFALQLAAALLAFGGAWGWLKLELPGSGEAKDWLVSSVTKDMDFQAIEAWYGSTFGGSPTFFPFNRDEPDTQEVAALFNADDTVAPVTGKLLQTFAQNGTGVKVSAPSGSEVLSVYTGRIQQVNTNKNGGITVIVQHENHVVTVYGNLADTAVKTNDWVEKGQKLGSLGTSGGKLADRALYFAVQQYGKSLDPAEVIDFD